MTTDALFHFSKKRLVIIPLGQGSKLEKFAHGSPVDFDDDTFFRRFEAVTTRGLPSAGVKCKAVVITLDGTEFKTSAETYTFRQKCSDICRERGIVYFFAQLQYLDIAYHSSLAIPNSLVQDGENMFVLNFNLEKPFGCIIRKEMDCFRVIADKIHAPYFTLAWGEEILHKYGSKMCLLQCPNGRENSEEMEGATKWLKDGNWKKCVCLKDHWDLNDMYLSDEINKVFDSTKPKNRLFVFPPFGKFKVEIFGKILFETTTSMNLPLEKSWIIDYEFLQMVYHEYPIGAKPYRLEEKSLLTKTKKVNIIFKIDRQSFYELRVEPVAEEIVEKSACGLAGLSIAPTPSVAPAAAPTPSAAAAAVVDAAAAAAAPTPSAAAAPSAAPVAAAVVDAAVEKEPEMFKMVFGKQEFSVFLISENGVEKVLPDENGCEKIPIFIAFNEEKYYVGQKAKQVFEEAPKMVVFDLIKLCSIDSAEIENPKWGFSVCKEEGKIVIDMETINGKRRCHNFFLLAMVLRKGRQIVKKELGKNLDKIQIEFDGFEANEILKKNVIEAAALLNNVYHDFV